MEKAAKSTFQLLGIASEEPIGTDHSKMEAYSHHVNVSWKLLSGFVSNGTDIFSESKKGEVSAFHRVARPFNLQTAPRRLRSCEFDVPVCGATDNDS